MITDPDDYFLRGCGRCARFDTNDCSAHRWADGLAALRSLCLTAGLTETAKWGHPCYTYLERNIALIGAFRSDFRLTFFDAALLEDPGQLLQRRGPNTTHPDMLVFHGRADVTQISPAILDFLDKSKQNVAAGLRPAKAQIQVDLPEELVEALDDDPELAEAFHALTPGRQRSYVLNLASAKASQTRYRRIAGFRDRILSGRGANER
ncbi:MAG: YdeI/OmpD-associated family protein [Paracoccaceae bacterium]